MIRFENVPASALPSEIVRRIKSEAGAIVRLGPHVVRKRLAELDMVPSELFWNRRVTRIKRPDGLFSTINMNLCQRSETLAELTDDRSDLFYAPRFYTPIYLDHARFVFYYRTTPVLECTVINAIMVEFIHIYHPILIRRYVFYHENIVSGAAVVRFDLLALQLPLPLYRNQDYIYCPVYSYDMLGCEEIDAMNALVYVNDVGFSLTFSQTGAVFSHRVGNDPVNIESYRLRRPGFGHNGLFFGAKLPKDEYGRYVVVLPAGPNLALPAANVELFAEGMRRLYQVITGSEPVWLTPAGPKSFDELVWE